jgi:hypothetical protein
MAGITESRGDGPGQVPDSAEAVAWQERADADGHYGVLRYLLAAGADPARIRYYRDPERLSSYWVVELDDGRLAVLTDDTEDHVSWLEGPWPFKATLVSPDGVREELDDSLKVVCDLVVEWNREAAGGRGTPEHRT